MPVSEIRVGFYDPVRDTKTKALQRQRDGGSSALAGLHKSFLPSLMTVSFLRSLSLSPCLRNSESILFFAISQG